MLIENTLFGERDKIEIALETLRTFEPDEGYYVAYSGGKDSTVILDLVRLAKARLLIRGSDEEEENEYKISQQVPNPHIKPYLPTNRGMATLLHF